jgi:hypothetical protein
MTSVVVSDDKQIRKLTIDELDAASGGDRPPPDPKLVGTGLFPPGPTVVGAGVFQLAGIIVPD